MKKASPPKTKQTRRGPPPPRPDNFGQEPPGGDDSLFDTRTIAAWLGVSCQHLEAERIVGRGPPVVRVTSRLIRYRKRDVIDFLRARTSAAAPAECEA